jgi:2-polyprenyl-3-methyl-5-hydroxy-6-metoxy-1,4-benzoquinol methylase
LRAAQTNALSATVNEANMLHYWATKLSLRPGMSILDVGRAEGRFLEIGRLMGFDMFGVDVSDFYVRLWAQRNLEATATTAEVFAESHAGAFDLITARQVIEHVANPVAMADACATLLRPGGHLLLETGDAGSLQALVQGRRWSFWAPVEGLGAHTSFLTLKAARHLGLRTGLTFRGWVPHFRYRSLDSYRVNHATESLPWVLVKYVFHRSPASGGRCFWYTRPR